MADDFKQAALDYHELPTPGKISIELTTSADTPLDLALAYSPGVAEPCIEIARDPELAYRYTAKGNLVAVISNGTAVLGLGDIGALASKPVMEGKGLLFKRFAGIDAIDIEVDTKVSGRSVVLKVGVCEYVPTHQCYVVDAAPVNSDFELLRGVFEFRNSLCLLFPNERPG